MKIKTALIFISLSISGYLFSNTCTSGSGSYVSWAATSWSCTGDPAAGPPGCSDAIQISGTIEMSEDVDFSACPSPMVITITGTGTLNFTTNGVRLKLPAGSTIVIQSGGQIIKTFPGGGSSALISSGGTNLWVAGDGTVSGPAELGPSPLPIELLGFNADICNKNVCLNWSTATETNNDYFTVERSKNGVDFEIVSVVDGAGNSISVLQYSSADNIPYEGISYYRLKQTDFDGASSYSNIATVDFSEDVDFSLNVYPNPSDGKNINISFNADLEEEVLVVVYDALGKESYSKVIITEEKGENVFTIDRTGKLLPGVYIITATSKQSIYNKKMIVK